MHLNNPLLIIYGLLILLYFHLSILENALAIPSPDTTFISPHPFVGHTRF